MKIFFCKPESSNFTFGQKFIYVFAAITAATLLIAQCIHFISSQAVPTSAVQKLAPSAATVILDAGGETVPDGVQILLNGEVCGRFDKDNKALCAIERSTVIEVLSDSDTTFEVGVVCGDDAAAISGSEKILCKRGINFIGRYCRTE